MKNPTPNSLDDLQQQYAEEEHALHLRIAEQGKLLALDDKHTLALKYYRKALELAVQTEDSDNYILHYTLCMLESLELLGEYESVMQYCDHALKTHKKQGVSNERVASLMLRKAVLLLKAGKVRESVSLLEKVLPSVAKSGENLLLCQALLEIAEAGKAPFLEAVIELQRQHRYYSVRKDTVKPDIAITLPDSAFH